MGSEISTPASPWVLSSMRLHQKSTQIFSEFTLLLYYLVQKQSVGQAPFSTQAGKGMLIRIQFIFYYNCLLSYNTDIKRTQGKNIRYIWDNRHKKCFHQFSLSSQDVQVYSYLFSGLPGTALWMWQKNFHQATLGGRHLVVSIHFYIHLSSRFFMLVLAQYSRKVTCHRSSRTVLKEAYTHFPDGLPFRHWADIPKSDPGPESEIP